MANEIVQWLAIITLLLVVLGLLRQVAMTLPSDVRSVPSGPTKGARIPSQVMSRFKQAGLPEAVDRFLIAFVTENCARCQSLLADLERRTERDSIGLPLLLVSRKASTRFGQALAGLGIPYLDDADGSMWQGLEISATPFVMLVDRNGRVHESEVTHRVENVATTDTASGTQRGEATIAR